MDPRRSQVVELRYFGGLNNEEIAGVLKFRKHGDSRLEPRPRMALSTTHRERGELTPERWEQISRIFNNAIALDGEERSAYVAGDVVSINL